MIHKEVVPRFVAGSAPFKFENASISFPIPSKVPPLRYSDSDEPWFDSSRSMFN